MKKYISLFLKAAIFLLAIIGVAMSSVGNPSAFLYFTHQSNIFIAIIAAVGFFFVASNKDAPTWCHIVRFIGTVAISLTGIVFVAILAPTLGFYAWATNNVLTHVYVPLLAIIDLFVRGKETKIETKHVPYALIPAGLYLIFAIAGFVLKWDFGGGVNYPYFFLNWTAPFGLFGFSSLFPWMGNAYWLILIALIVLLVASIYAALLNKMRKNRGNGKDDERELRNSYKSKNRSKR